MDERSGDGVSTGSRIPSNGESSGSRQQLSPPALLGKEKLAHNAKAATAVVFGTVVLINVGFLYSAIPAIRGRGAPYVSTSTENAKIMFQQLRRYLPNRTNVESHSRAGSLTQPMGSSFSLKHHSLEALPLSHQNHTSPNSFVFVDLGSGDGRLVLRAAQEGIFTACIGYELNPLLVWYSRIRQLLVTTTRQVETWWTKARNRRMELHCARGGQRAQLQDKDSTGSVRASRHLDRSLTKCACSCHLRIWIWSNDVATAQQAAIRTSYWCHCSVQRLCLPRRLPSSK
jgi:hypothetical protein